MSELDLKAVMSPSDETEIRNLYTILFFDHENFYNSFN